ncbi:hypothetical protein HHUSO_G28497 [Huso huso]|uniref:Uncharacterized protein n=1 Tax=Huso huso TaxID=61971 RepID=A0ABR0YJB3_HUSHU
MGRKQGTSRLWSGEDQDLPICRVLIKACLSNNKVAKVGEIKGIIGETQKRALNKPGGNRYKFFLEGCSQEDL